MLGRASRQPEREQQASSARTLLIGRVSTLSLLTMFLGADAEIQVPVLLIWLPPSVSGDHPLAVNAYSSRQLNAQIGCCLPFRIAYAWIAASSSFGVAVWLGSRSTARLTEFGRGRLASLRRFLHLVRLCQRFLGLI